MPVILSVLSKWEEWSSGSWSEVCLEGHRMSESRPKKLGLQLVPELHKRAFHSHTSTGTAGSARVLVSGSCRWLSDHTLRV